MNLMTFPSIVLGLISSFLIGALFHLWRDGGPWRLVLYLILSTAGFTAGQLIGVWQGWVIFPLGPLDLGFAVAGSFVFLVIGYWLSLVELRRESKPNDEV